MMAALALCQAISFKTPLTRAGIEPPAAAPFAIANGHRFCQRCWRDLDGIGGNRPGNDGRGRTHAAFGEISSQFFQRPVHPHPGRVFIRPERQAHVGQTAVLEKPEYDGVTVFSFNPAMAVSSSGAICGQASSVSGDGSLSSDCMWASCSRRARRRWIFNASAATKQAARCSQWENGLGRASRPCAPE